MLNGAFDATQHQPLDRTTIPAGEYPATISKTEVRKNRKGSGHHLQIEFTISEGKFQGRKVWQNLNCWHPNEKATQIAWSELSAIAHAVQVLNFLDTSALHNIPLLIQIIINQNGQNEYKAAKPIEHAGRQPSPGRAYAQNNPPAPQHAAQSFQAPQASQYTHPNGQPMTPAEVQAMQTNQKV